MGGSRATWGAPVHRSARDGGVLGRRMTTSRARRVAFRTAMPRIFRHAGYATVFVSGGAATWHNHADFWLRQGFDAYEDRSVIDLLRASHTYLNERVALHYGITDVKGDRFRRVELTNSTRWGLLGKGAVLMATSYGNRTAPVLRGAYILENITGTPPTAPPPGVGACASTNG